MSDADPDPDPDPDVVATITDEYIALSVYENGMCITRTQIDFSELGLLSPPGEDMLVALLADVDDESIEIQDEHGTLEPDSDTADATADD
jgi:hypothetical protein